jgi:predicted neuraminidase
MFSPRKRHFGLRFITATLLCFVLIAWDLSHRRPNSPAARATWPNMAAKDLTKPLVLVSQGHIPMPANTPAAHASSLLAMPPAHPAALMAFWFAGTKESAPDIGIAAAAFDRATQQWQAASFVLHRSALGAALGFNVRRLGNPVPWLDARGQVHLFVVATGLGGWAASRIVHLRQRQAAPSLQPLTFELANVLPLSWLWNTSHLVRTSPLALQDGGMVLPVYFELGLKYPIALRFDGRGDFLSMVNISGRTHVLQPTLLMQTESRWLALMRDQRPEGRVTAALTQDGGLSWNDLPDLSLVNPDASIAGLGLSQQRMVLAHNTSPHSRNVLDLSQSTDGQNWELIQHLAQGTGSDEYSYPAVTWVDNNLWVTFTDQRQHIAWHRFAPAAD